jgi:hypothetical protein
MKKLSVMSKKKVAINRGLSRKIIDEMKSNGIDTAAEYFFAALDGFIADEKDPVAKKAYANYMLIFSRASQEADQLVGSQSNKILGDVHSLSGILED